MDPCLIAFATEFISKLGGLVVDFTVKRFKYMIHQDKIFANLKEEHNQLKAIKTNLQEVVDAYRRKGLEVESNVEEWLRKVEDADKELEKLYEDEANKNKECFGGKCPHLAFNYSLGKRATKKVQEIASLKEEEKKIKPKPCPKSPPRLGPLITEDIKSLKSREAIKMKVVEKLKDERLKRISICGMGGVGKTTLVYEVIQNVETTKLFDKVVMAAVSQNPDYGKIQNQIAERLCLEFRAQNMQDRALELHKKVKGDKTKVLIVLDDVWEELDFKSIGLPSLENQKGCKILFTSRDEKVCQKMRSQENIVVQVLSEDEAWYLFQEMAGDVVNFPNINHIAKEVAKECGGLPLALVIVARALEREEHFAWENALQQLRNAPLSSLSDVQKRVYSRIEHSVSFLSNEEQRNCLMLCGLFPEDFDIPIESLLRLGMGLGMFKVDGTLRKTRNLVHSLISHLKRCFLLLDSDEPECVKMHDVVRDVVISIASKAPYGFMVQYSTELKSQQKEGNLDHVKAMSLILDETERLENVLLEYPTLQLLQARSKSKDQNSWPDQFFKCTNKLKVLTMENFIVTTLASFNQAWSNLHTLQLENCNVGDISFIGKELKNLEVLSFAHSNIKEIPTEIGELGFLKLLDLTGCDDLYFISTNVFRRLSRLQELYFGVQNFPWMHHEDVLVELQSLSNQLKVIEFKVRKVETLPKDLTFKNLENFWVSVGPYATVERHGYLESNALIFHGVNHKSIKCSLMMKELVKKCEVLKLRKVEGLKNVICELDDSELPFPYLKDMRIDSCDSLEYVFDGVASMAQIQSLSLEDLDNLREICNVCDQHDKELTIKFLNLLELKLRWLPCLTGFSKVIDLEESTQPFHHEAEWSNATQSADLTMLGDAQTSSAHEMDAILPIPGKLFSTKWIHQFPKLQKLLVDGCDSLEMIFDLQGNSQLSGQSNDVLFPQLKEIHLYSLRKLTYVWGNVPNNVQGFQNLRSMKIRYCWSLKYAFTPAIVRAITKLETLQVENCKLMQNLVDDSGDKEEGGHKEKGKVKISFDRLNSLTLYGLPNIASICPKSYELEFPSIRQLKIRDCPKLNISSLLNQEQAKSNNIVTVTSDFQNLIENHSRNIDWHSGCTPFCSKLIRQVNLKKKSNETMLSPQDQDHVSSNSEMGYMPNLEELLLSDFDLNDELLQQEGDTKLARHCPTIDGSLFPKLTSLIVRRCNKIRVLLSLSSLVCLENLQVSCCENMEEIMCQEDSKVSENKITLTRLQSLVLESLPNLKALTQSSHLLDFPSLREVRVKDCPKMEMFSRGPLQMPKLDDFEIIGAHGRNYMHNNKSDLNTAFRGFKAFEELHELEMVRCNNNDILEKHIISISEMGITKFRNLSKLFPFKEIHMFQNVRELTIEECGSLVELFESEREMEAKKGFVPTHYEIETLKLENLPELREIWGPNIMRLVSFNNLTSVKIVRCGNLKSVLSYSMAGSLVQLKELYVSGCKIMENVVRMEDEDIDDGGSKIKTIFLKLLTLRLENLPKLECVCSRNGGYGYDIPLSDEEEEDKGTNDDDDDKQEVQISIPELQKLVLRDLPRLKCFYPGAYDYELMVSSDYSKEGTTSFPNKGNVTITTPSLREVSQSEYVDDNPFRTMGDVNLTIHYIQNSDKYKREMQKIETFRCVEQCEYQHLVEYIIRVPFLQLESCNKLLSCVPSNMIHLFQHLKQLLVQQCGCLEEIFESTDYDYEGMELEVMELHCLPKLKHIWRNPDSTLGFQELRKLTIRECHDLRFVFPDVSVFLNRLQYLRMIEVSECNNMEEIIHNNNNNTEQKGAKIVLPYLYKIVLRKLPKLNCFCSSPSSFHFELPECRYIKIEECPKMESFCYGTIYTPSLWNLGVDERTFDYEKEKDVNEMIQEIRVR